MSKLQELQVALTEFMDSFQLVFDQDWDKTEHSIREGGYINGTFLNPEVEDESNNWWNRGSLLWKYRELHRLMNELGIPTDSYGECEVKNEQGT
jgi:hypothetical protein